MSRPSPLRRRHESRSLLFSILGQALANARGTSLRVVIDELLAQLTALRDRV